MTHTPTLVTDAPCGENHNLQLLAQTDSRAKVAFIIEPVRVNVAQGHLVSMAVFSAARITMATGTN